MKKIIVLLILSLSGCATSPNAVKEHNLVAAFSTEKTAHEVVTITAAMSKYCTGGLFDQVIDEHPAIGKATLSLKNKHADHYYFLVDAEEISMKGSMVKVYHFFDTDNSRKMGNAVQNWVEDKNKDCVPGF